MVCRVVSGCVGVWWGVVVYVRVYCGVVCCFVLCLFVLGCVVECWDVYVFILVRVGVCLCEWVVGYTLHYCICKC